MEREVPAQPFPHAEFAAQKPDGVDLPIENAAGQAELGDSPAEHSTGFKVGIEECRGMAAPKQVVCGSESRRPGADDGYLFPRSFLFARKVARIRGKVAVGAESMKIAHGE